MPTQNKEEKELQLAKKWATRVRIANAHYKKWAEAYHVSDLEKAYYGFQWEECGYKDDYMPYVINMIFSTIDVKMPGLIFDKPVYTVKPKPSKIDFDPDNARMTAQLQEDTLNTVIQHRIPDFANEIELAILDAWFRFGIVEVDYSADYIRNPDAGKPFFKSDFNALFEDTGEIAKQPDLLTQDERVYARRIPAERFRVGGVDTSSLKKASWYGYWDKVNKEDLLATATINKGYNKDRIRDLSAFTNTNNLTNIHQFDINYYDRLSGQAQEEDVVLIWKIWDKRAGKFYIFDQELSNLLYEEELDDRVYHFGIRFRPMLKGWYPIPPVFQWISPQAEVNETRESARIHRRRFQRKYIARRGAFEQEELDKLQNGEDGTIAESDVDLGNTIIPMPNANLGAQHDQSTVTARDDFFLIAGTSAEQRGQDDGSTATASNIKERRAEIRESRDKAIVGNWLVEIGGAILTIVSQNFTLPFYIKTSLDHPQALGEQAFLEEQYQIITSRAIDSQDFEVVLKVGSISPLDQQQEKNKLLEFLSIVTQYPQVTVSPVAIRHIADLVGIRNERFVADFARNAQLLQTLQILQLAQQTGQDPAQLFLESFMRNNAPGAENPVAQRTIGQLTPPDQQQITNQVQNQLIQGDQF